MLYFLEYECEKEKHEQEDEPVLDAAEQAPGGAEEAHGDQPSGTVRPRASGLGAPGQFVGMNAG